MKNKIACWLIAGLIWTVPGGASAVDRGHLQELKPETAAKVLKNFIADVYYVPHGVARSSDDSDKRFSEPTGFFIPLFIEPSEAVAHRNDMMAQTKAEAAPVKQANMGNILTRMYDTRDSKENSVENPVFAIFSSFSEQQIYPEYLKDDQTGALYTVEISGKKIIPAFLVREEAIALQNKLQAESGRQFTRVGLDFKKFLKFMEDSLADGPPVKVLGHRSGELLDWLKAHPEALD